MLFAEIVQVAILALRANKLRSLLTMLGIVIGVGSVITMISLGNGAERAVSDKIARLGTTVIQIDPKRVQQAGVASATPAKLTTKDADMIVERSPNVLGVNYTMDRTLRVIWRNKNASVQVTGSNATFLQVRGFKLAYGRFFTDAEDRGMRHLAVIGAGVLPYLTNDDGAGLVGEPIRIAGRAFTVVGVLQNRGVTGVGDADEQVVIPFRTGRFEVFGTDRLQDIWVRASSEDSLMRAMFEVQSALRRSQKLRPGSPDNFNMRNQSDFLVALSETTQVFTLLLAGIAGVSLLVGGIGIMNIMLVSVTERTREIGVRKALGATRRNILLQFLIEAVVLCLMGGALGVAAGLSVAMLSRQTMGWTTTVDPRSIVLSFAFATATGLIFGVWPARRAATLDPVIALRYE